MRGSIAIEKILEALQSGAEGGATLLDIAVSDVDARRKAKRAMRGDGIHFNQDWVAAFRDRQKFYGLMAHLKRQGFVEAKKSDNKSIWKITKSGLAKLKVLKERNKFSRLSASYPKSADEGGLKIIAYDIPSADSQKKRLWLRWALLDLGFTMLQRSVWVGKKKIPEQFLKDLRERGLLPYVEIFEVAKTGTLKKVSR